MIIGGQNTNNGYTDDFLREHSIPVNTHLKGKCRWCPRGFETGERIVFCAVKNVQMKWLEEDEESGEEAGFGEQHTIMFVNAHLNCAQQHKDEIRSVINPRSAKSRL